MPQSLTLDDLDALTRAAAPPPAAPTVARPRAAAPTAKAYTLDDLDALTKPAAPAKAQPAAKIDNPDQHGFLRSFYDEGIAPLVDTVLKVAQSDDMGQGVAKEILSGFIDQAKTFAAHPDIRNLPLVGTGATATAARMQRQYNAGNYPGMIGSAFGFLGQFAAPEAATAAWENLPVAAKTAAAAADATGRWADAAATGAKAAAPDVAKGAAKFAGGAALSHILPAPEFVRALTGLELGERAGALQMGRGLQAGRAAYGDVRAAQAAADATAAAKAATAGRVPIWQQAYDDAEAARAAEAARPPTEPLWPRGAPGPGESAPETAQPAAETPTPAAETAAPAEAPTALYHGAPRQLDSLRAGSMMTDSPEWAAGYTTKIHADGAEDFIGKVHSAAPDFTNPAPEARSLHGAEQSLLDLASSIGKPYRGLDGAARLVHSELGFDGIYSRGANGKVNGAIPFTDIPVENLHDPAAVLRDAVAGGRPIASNMEAALNRAEAPTAAPTEETGLALTPQHKLEDLIHEHTAYLRGQAQDIEWARRARRADRYAQYLVDNNLAATPENLTHATHVLVEPRGYPSPETSDMIKDRVDWYNAKQAAAAEAAPEAPAAQHEATARALPPAGATVDGLEVHPDIPNTDSIHSSIDNPEELPGVREIPMSLFPGAGKPGDANFSYSATENTRTLKLAKDIEANGHIKPLIVAFDKEGPYIVEGGHRFDALGYLGKKSFPAKVVLDTDSLDAAAPPAKLPAAVNPLTAAPADVGAANASEVGAAPTGAPEAKSLTEQQLEASIAAIQSKRGQKTGAAGQSGHVEGEIPISGSGPGSEMDARGVGGRPALAAPDRTSAGTRGEHTAVDVPGEQRAYPAQYTVRELDEVRPSHLGATFQPNPEYTYNNDRFYDDPRNQRKIVEGSTIEKFKPRHLLNTAPTSEIGPPIVDAAGNVLGGNGRTMILQRVYDSSEGGQTYRAELDRTAQHYGIDPASYAHMKQPVLVRELAPEVLKDEGAAARAITDFNKVGTAALTPSERAIADARGVSQNTLDDIAARMDRLGPDATLAQTVEGRQGIEILRNLERDGVISPQEGAELATETKLTRGGKERISGLMLGRFFSDAKQMDNLPDSLRNKLERMAAPLARAETVADYSLRPTIKEALDLLEDFETRGAATLDDVLNQRGLFGEREYSPDAIAFAKALKSTNPVELTHAARRYAERVKYAEQYQGPGMFNDIPPPLAPTAAFRDSFEHLAK